MGETRLFITTTGVFSTVSNAVAVTCTSYNGGPIAVDTDTNGQYIYNPSSTTWTQVRCPMTADYPRVQYVSPSEWWVNDGRSTNSNPSVFWQDFAVQGDYNRDGNDSTSNEFSSSFKDPTLPLIHIQDTVQQKVAITERSTADMLGWLPPVTSGRRSKLYRHFWNISSI